MKELQDKLEYCLNCRTKPCQNGCPLQNDIPTFIAYSKQGDYKEAYETLCQTTVMPFVCGRICPHTKQCQGACVRGIKENPVSIGEIESKIGDIAIQNKWYLPVEKPTKKNKKIAIIGAGPAGITASLELAKRGWEVTLYEKQEKIGGILRYGIPKFRLDKLYIDVLEEQLINYGVKIETKKQLGENLNLENLITKNDAVFLSIGANKSLRMGIPGEMQENVLGANELLEKEKHLNYKMKKVIVIGGGNVAMDVSRTIKKMGAEKVIVVYRRARAQMPAEPKEVEEAIKEGIEFLFQINVKEIKGNKIHCVKTMLIKKEGEDREFPVEIQNSDFELDADYIVMAIGSKLDKSGLDKISINEKGYIETNENYQTSLKSVYAAGDSIGCRATVAWACYSGREAAKCIDKFEK